MSEVVLDLDNEDGFYDRIIETNDDERITMHFHEDSVVIMNGPHAQYVQLMNWIQC